MQKAGHARRRRVQTVDAGEALAGIAHAEGVAEAVSGERLFQRFLGFHLGHVHQVEALFADIRGHFVIHQASQIAARGRDLADVRGGNVRRVAAKPEDARAFRHGLLFPAPPRRREGAEAKNLFVFAPGNEVGQRVRADDVDKFAFRLLRAQAAQGVHGVGRALAAHLHVRNGELVPRRQLRHPQAVLRHGVAVLVGRIAVRQEDGCGKGELFLRHAQKRRVAEMHGIERAAEYADCSVFHTPIIHHPRAGEKRFCARGAAWAALFGEKFVREG